MARELANILPTAGGNFVVQVLSNVAARMVVYVTLAVVLDA